MHNAAKLRNASLVLLIFFSNCLAFTIRESEAAIPSTHMLNTAELGFKLEFDGSRIRFQSGYIYLGSPYALWSYIGNDMLKFYNIKMGASICMPTWTIGVVGPANLTVTRFFIDSIFEADIVADSAVTSTTRIYCEEPKSVEGADSYSWQNHMLTITITHESLRHVKIIFNPPASFIGQLIDSLITILGISLVLALLTFFIGQIPPEDSPISEEVERYTAIILGLCLLAAMLSTLGLLSYI